MADLIDRQMTIDALCKSECGWNNAECRHKDDTDFCVTCDNVKIIKSLPSIHSEHKTGQWIPSDSELEIKCNKCGKDFSEYVDSIDYIYLAEYPKFCPNCGVKMEEGEQE